MTQEFALFRRDDADVAVSDKEHDRQALVPRAEADVMQLGVVAKRDRAVAVDLVVADAEVRLHLSLRLRLDLRVEDLARRLAAERPVRACLVVVRGEAVELAAGLGMVRTGALVAHAEPLELRLEHDLPVAVLRGEDAAVVGEDAFGGAVAGAG